MNKKDILETIEMLAASQGFYGRLLQALRENPEAGEEFLEAAEAQGFQDSVDLVLWLES